MKIVIVGCGKIGKTIIDSLVKERHDVFAIDTNPFVVEYVRNTYDIIALTGNGTEYETLKEIGADKAELFISVTNSDELNMLACFAAKRMGAKHTVARIRELENNRESLNFMQQQLDLSLAINPERMAAEAMYNVLRLPSATKVEKFPNSKLEMIEVQLKKDSPLNGLSLIDLRKKAKQNFLVCTVEREGQVHIPNGTFKLKSEDKVGIITADSDVQKLLKLIGISNIQVKNVMILGAGTVSTYLAQMLIGGNHSVKLIDNDEQICDAVCETLPSAATIICGNGMSQDLLVEEGILSTDAFVALTGKDEVNILMSFYAKSQRVPKIITKVNKSELSSLAEELGLDSLISPKNIAANVIVKYARALQNSIGSQIETLYSLTDGKAEAIEFKVLSDFEFTHIPLKDMKTHKNVLFAGITRGKEAFIPTGDDMILPGDKVTVELSPYDLTKGRITWRSK